MKTRIILSLVVATLAVVFAFRSDSTAEAAPPQRATFDTGVLSPAEGQILRLSVTAGAGNDALTVRFVRYEYIDTGTTAGVRRLAVASQDVTDPIALAPGEAFCVDIPTSDWVRGAVEANSRNVRVNAMIIDAATGEVLSFGEIIIGGHI